jgi:prephenate dehydrogenase
MILANALFTLTRSSKAWHELSRMAGPGFKDMTRLASQSPDMEVDIVLTNRDGIAHWIERMQEELERWKELVNSDEETLFQALYRANLDRMQYMLEGPTDPSFATGAQVPSSSDQLADLLFSARLMQRMREATHFYEDKAKGPPKRRSP